MHEQIIESAQSIKDKADRILESIRISKHNPISKQYHWKLEHVMIFNQSSEIQALAKEIARLAEEF